MINLRSALRRKLLGNYFTNPTASHYVREVARILEVDPANLSREFARLEREGVFVSERRGGQKYFRLNKQYPLCREVRSIVSKTVGVVPQLRSEVAVIPGIRASLRLWFFCQRVGRRVERYRHPHRR